MSVFKVKFTSFKEVGDHIEYQIVLTDVESGNNFHFSHRYSILRQIYLSLPQSLVGLKFPEKRIFGNRNAKFLNLRKSKLESIFSAIFSRPELSKLLMNSIYFKIHCDEPQPKTSSRPLILSVCKECTKSISWGISNITVDKFIDISLHPGTLNDSEIEQTKESLIERCKDFKLESSGQSASIGTLEEALSEVGKHNWISKAFDNCFDSFKIKG